MSREVTEENESCVVISNEPPVSSIQIKESESDPYESSSSEDELTRDDLDHLDPFTPRKQIPRYSSSYAFKVTDGGIPKSFSEAMLDENKHLWMEPIKEELEAILSNDTWEIVDRVAKKELPYKWVFNVKTDEKGEISRYKARLVIGGHKQEKGVDYEEIYAAVARSQTIRLLLAYATILDWEVRQLDYKTAFLNGEIEEDIYIAKPAGLDLVGFKLGEGKMLKLKKALYGLKQAPRQWKKKVDEMMKNLGYHKSEADNAVYYKENIIIAVYVDDLLIMGKLKKTMLTEEEKLMAMYQAKSLGDLKHYLGMVWTRNRQSKKSWLDQSLYCKEILERFEMNTSRPNKTPIQPGSSDGVEITEAYADVEKYQKAVGSLIYLSTGTRPDIAYTHVNIRAWHSTAGKPHAISPASLLY